MSIEENTNITDTEDSTTVDDTKSTGMTAEQFNKAMSARERAFEKKMAKREEEFTKMIERFAPPAKEEKELSRTAELERTVKDLSKNIQERDARDKSMSLRRTAEHALKSHGIDNEFTEHALAYLIDAKNAIRHDEDGNIIMVLNGVEYEDLDTGMAVWSASRDAKLYKSATGSKGSGDGNRKINSNDTPKNGDFELKRIDDWEKSNKSLTIKRESKIALNNLISQKLQTRR